MKAIRIQNVSLSRFLLFETTSQPERFCDDRAGNHYTHAPDVWALGFRGRELRWPELTRASVGRTTRSSLITAVGTDNADHDYNA